MKFMQVVAAGVAAVVLAGGCVESKTVMKLKKDGSGTVVVEEYMSPQITAMMDSMSGMGEAMTGGTNAAAGAKAPAKAADPLAMFKDQIEKRAAQMGKGVALVSKEAKNNAAGWKGYVATYSFKNVNELNLAKGGDVGGEGDDKKDDAYRFQFTPGSKAVIKTMPKKREAATAAPVEAAPEMGGADQMAAMMAPMLQGMRIQVELEVEGKITSSNAKYKEGDNRIVLMDVPMEKLLGNAEAMKIVQSKAVDSDEKLMKLNIAGLKIEDPSKALTIEFQ